MQAEGEFALVKENIERALGLSGQPVKRGSMAHDHDVYMMLADGAARARDLIALRAYTPRLEELAQRDGHKLYLAIAHRAWGVAHALADESAKAETRLNQARELFQGLETRWQIARTMYELGELEQARHNVAAARDWFAQALTLFEAMSARPDADRTRAALAALQ
ncbi:MAG: hypothetical protein HY868_26410 [Chloroflexi bacterium]|nr:hypothetical protein [Chloroflexota bacterium]